MNFCCLLSEGFPRSVPDDCTTQTSYQANPVIRYPIMLRKFKKSKSKSGRNKASNRRRSKRQGFRPETLEQRLVLSAVSVSGSTLFFNANPGETNDLTISETAGVLTVRDTGAPITPGAGPFTVVSPQ